MAIVTGAMDTAIGPSNRKKRDMSQMHKHITGLTCPVVSRRTKKKSKK